MSYDLSRLAPLEPTTADARISLMRAKGWSFTEYEVKPNGDVLGSIRNPLRNRGFALDVVVPFDGGKVQVLG